MNTRKSDFVRNQADYKIMKQYIDDMLNKPTPNPSPGSIILGKKYANNYLNEINNMLSSEYIDESILLELRNKVLPDLEFIREDCKRRLYWSEHVQDNDNMMSMILDFVLTLSND